MKEDFHNTAKKIHITHLKLASNLSLNRQRLELIRKQDGVYDKIPLPILTDKIDDIRLNQHSEDI